MSSNLSENPGCLGSFLSFFKKQEKREVQESYPYRLRDDFLSPAEFSFYKVLTSLTGAHYIILTKVRLADIFFVIRPNENMPYFNRISSRHVDFLLCNPTTMKPIAGIELDDASHTQASRQQRDEFVDKVFAAAELPILHMPVRQQYSAQEVNARLSQLFRVETPSLPQMNVNVPAQPYVAKQVEFNPPICPKCGIPMVLRTATQGTNQGQKFYGCTNFPRCREVKAFSK